MALKTNLIPKISLSPFNAVIDVVPRDWIIFILRVEKGDLFFKISVLLKLKYWTDLIMPAERAESYFEECTKKLGFFNGRT